VPFYCAEAICIVAQLPKARKLLLDGHERITWNIQVLDGYDIFFSAKARETRFW
jgi:hypothetical protein